MIGNSTKIYYLSNLRSITIGSILIIMGLAISLIGLNINLSLLDNFQRIVLDFSGVLNFFASLIMLLFKIGFVALGIFFLKNSKKIERAKIDNKGFYFKEMPKGKIEMLAFDLGELKFIKFADINDIIYKKNIWRGEQIEMLTETGLVKLTTLDVLSKKEKMEIVALVKSRI